MSILRRLLLPCALLSACVVQAGVPEGVDAFAQSRFGEARKELAGPAEAGDAQAMAHMGEMLMRGLAGPRDEAKGAELIRQAADKGEAAAQNTLGAWLASGTQGYAKDDVNALAWFKLAAEQKNAAAMWWIGVFTEAGRAGIPQDNLVALDLYKKAGELGNAIGMTSTGRLYALGRGVSADGGEALRWLRRAAALNNYEAFGWIGSVYEFGRGGIAKNPTLAYAWYGAVPANAQASILKSATDGKERLAKTLSSSEIQEAEKQSKTVAAANAVNLITTQIAGRTGASNAPRTGVYGSGVVVSDAGDIVTNEHVINNCARIRIQPLGVTVKLVAKDARNDLALLRAESAELPPATLRPGATCAWATTSSPSAIR